jgi:hypothetical protein
MSLTAFDAERELNSLMLRHAQLRENLEVNLDRVSEIEQRFLSQRPWQTMNEATQRELRRKMILARPWRDELNVAYRALLATTIELDRAVQQIHQYQSVIANSVTRR